MPVVKLEAYRDRLEKLAGVVEINPITVQRLVGEEIVRELVKSGMDAKGISVRPSYFPEGSTNVMLFEATVHGTTDSKIPNTKQGKTLLGQIIRDSVNPILIELLNIPESEQIDLFGIEISVVDGVFVF